MGYKEITVGADRFLSLKWANYAFELFQTDDDEDFLYRSLRSFIDPEIKGEETTRKTANQLKRLWLTKDDPFQSLRISALPVPYISHPEFLSIFHLGIAMNVFPIYYETLKAIGMLDRVINPIPKQAITDRVLEAFGNTSSIPRAVARILQTLEDWNFIDVKSKSLTLKNIRIWDFEVAAWFITALVKVNNSNGINISDLPLLPEKLGIQLENPREIIQKSKNLGLIRDTQGLEIITIRN